MLPGPARAADHEAAIVAVAQQPRTSETLALLVAAPRDPDVGVRAAVAGAFGRIPTQSPGMLLALQAAMKDASPTVRQPAAAILMPVRAHTEEAFAVLREDLKSPDASIRKGAATTLLGIVGTWSVELAHVEGLGSTGGGRPEEFDRQAADAKAGMALLAGAVAEVVALLGDADSGARRRRPPFWGPGSNVGNTFLRAGLRGAPKARENVARAEGPGLVHATRRALKGRQNALAPCALFRPFRARSSGDPIPGRWPWLHS